MLIMKGVIALPQIYCSDENLFVAPHWVLLSFFLYGWLMRSAKEVRIDELQWLLLITSCKWLHACEHDYYLCARCYMHGMCTYSSHLTTCFGCNFPTQLLALLLTSPWQALLNKHLEIINTCKTTHYGIMTMNHRFINPR